jgi:hypothetical protein
VAEDPLDAALRKIRDRDAIAYASPRSMAESGADVPRLLYAVETVLELHAQTAYVAYTEACSNHLYTILPRRTCPDCRRVERLGCQRCRDENGNPAKPEDCAERNAILAALTGKGNNGGK